MESSEDFPSGAVDRSLPASPGDTGSNPVPGRVHVPGGNQACEPRARTLQPEKPPQWETCAPQLEEAQAGQWRHSAAKNKINK